MSLDSTIRLGWIPYLNLLPLEIEFKKIFGISGQQISFYKGHPKEVNHALKSGLVDLAPASSINLLQDPNVEISLPLGIFSDGSVDSVFIGFRLADRYYYEHFKEIFTEIGLKYRRIFSQSEQQKETKVTISTLIKSTRISETEAFLKPPTDFHIRLSSASATSNALCKILFQMFSSTSSSVSVSCLEPGGKIPVNLSLDDEVRTGHLLIGDEALIKKASFPFVLDLGEIWQKVTGLPFVFALWQVGPFNLPEELRDILLDAAGLAQKRKDIDPAYYLQEINSDNPVLKIGDQAIKNYWKKIRYVLDERAIRGLVLFFQMAQQCCYQPASITNAGVKITKSHHRILNLTQSL